MKHFYNSNKRYLVSVMIKNEKYFTRVITRQFYACYNVSKIYPSILVDRARGGVVG
jgi:hypothetical protein